MTRLYRKKPKIIEAVQWFKHGDHPKVNKDVFSHEGGCDCPECMKPLDIHGTIKTLEGKHIVCPADWIIKSGTSGEFYTCKPDIFKATYEYVSCS